MKIAGIGLYPNNTLMEPGKIFHLSNQNLARNNRPKSGIPPVTRYEPRSDGTGDLSH